MRIEKSEINEDKALNHCLKNIELGNYRYVTYIDIHETDVNIYKNWLHQCETVDQNYFFMFIETGEEFKRFCGCSSFKIVNMFDSIAVEYPVEVMSSEDVINLICRWIEECDWYFVSGAIKLLTDKIIQSLGENDKQFLTD